MKKITKSTPYNGSSKTAKSGTGNNSKLEEFFHDELKDIYWAEKHLVKTLPKMRKASTSPELQSAIESHLEETKEHVARLEKVFDILGYKTQAKKCDAMAGLTKEGEEIIEKTDEGSSTRDVGVIVAAQKVEHYEIATYGSLAQLSKTLGYNEVTDLLESTLAEEKQADKTLSRIAEQDINVEAGMEPAMEED